MNSNPQRTQSPETREGRSRPISAASSARAAARVVRFGPEREPTRTDQILALLPATHNEIAVQLGITPNLALAFLCQLRRQGRAVSVGSKREGRAGPLSRIFARKAVA